MEEPGVGRGPSNGRAMTVTGVSESGESNYKRHEVVSAG